MANDPVPPPATPAAKDRPPKTKVRGRKRRIARWVIRVVVGVPILLIALSLLIAYSPLVESTVRSKLQDATGCDVEMDRAFIALDGRVEIRGLKLLVPGLSGPEAELLSARKAEIDLSWSAAMSWSGLSAVRPTSIRLTDPVFRLSQSIDDGSLNIASIAAAADGRPGGAGGGGGAGGPGKGLPLIPTVNVQDGRIEFAEHSERQARFDLLNTIHVAGAFGANADGSYRIRMQEVGRLPAPIASPEPGLPRGMILDGRIDLQRGEALLRLLNVPLEAWPPESVPVAFRETWRRLRIQGHIRETLFEYDRDNGVRLSVWPEDVAMDIPVPDDSAAADNLSLRAVNGKFVFAPEGVQAELEGVLEDQTKPVHVRFQTEGTALEAPLYCEIWGEGLTLARNPGFLPYIPPKAREFFVFFSGPTGEVDARVTIARGYPVNGKAARAIVTDGRVTVRNGTAAFHLFPYPFHNMEVHATFDEDHLNIHEIRGDGASGAVLRASAYASPMDDDARVDVSVRVTNAPVDQHLRAAMPGSRKQLVEVLFNERQYEELLKAGLISPPGTPPGRGVPPAFGLGGICNIDVTVHRSLGPVDDWQTDILVRFDEAGIVPKPFPFPIAAKNVEIHITDEEGTLTRGTFTGLRGGRANLSAHVLLEEDGENVLKPRLEIAAFEVPVDDLLIHAVPEDDSGTDPNAVSAKAILQRLDLRGNVDCSASIRDAVDDPGEIDYDVAVVFRELEARPRPLDKHASGGSVLMVSGASGRIGVTPREVRVQDLTGQLVVEEPGPRVRGEDALTESRGQFEVDLTAAIIPQPKQPDIGPPSASPIGEIDVRVRAVELDLGTPLPSLLSVFSVDIADVLAAIRNERKPEGHLDADVRLHRTADAPRPAVDAAFSNFADVSFDGLNGRVCLLDTTGSATFADQGTLPQGANARVGFEGFAARLQYDGVDSGLVEIDGNFAINPALVGAAPLDQAVTDAALELRLRDAMFEAPLVTELLRLSLSPPTFESWQSLRVAGVFDAHVDVNGAPTIVSGMLGPRSLVFERAGARARLSSVLGHVSFRTVQGAGRRSVEGRIENLGVASPAWRAELNGDWSFIAGERFLLETVIAMEGQTLTDDLLALLPLDAAAAMRAVNLQVSGGFSMPAATLAAVIPDAPVPGETEPPPASVRFAGRVRFANAAADIGAKLTQCDGEAGISIATLGDIAPAISIDFVAPSLVLADVSMTDAKALLVSVDPSGIDAVTAPLELRLPYFTASAHGGRVWAHANIGPAGEDDERRTFSADVVAAGVLFAPLLNELSSSPDPEPQGPPPPGSVAHAEPATPHEPDELPQDRTRGQADFWLSITGRAGDPQSHLGRGAIRVANGDVLRMPVVFPLVQMSNLMLPRSDRFGYMQAEFNLQGRTAAFESVAVLSDSISLMGEGTLTLPDMTLDMRFNSRSNRRIPLLSDMYEAVRDEIVTTRVRGTVGEPDIRSETLTTTRGILDSIFDPGGRQRSSIRTDDAARRELDRVDSNRHGERPLPPTTMPSRHTGVDG